MHSKNKISMILAAALLLFPTFVFAANGQAKGDSVNMALISLLGLMLILLFVIGMLANTLRNLSYVVRDKIRKDKNTAGNVVKALLVLLALSIPAIQSYAADAPKAATGPVTQYISGIPEGDFYTILGVIALELISIFALVYHINVLMKVIHSQPELAKAAGPVIEKSWFWDSFNAAASLEKEKDILMDHNYDGIQELDNSLPPWWKYGFYLTIIVAVIYLYRFHVSHDGLSPKEEYAAEMQKAAEDKEAYLATAGNLVDENTVTQLTDPNEIAAGKEIFVKTCAPCHLADGGGAVGPNLTDEYWLHGGGIKDIFKSIKYGWQDKGMKSWKDDFSPKQIQQLASFVKSLKGSHPAVPKLAQGELFIEAGAAPAANDSTKKAGDSTAVKK